MVTSFCAVGKDLLEVLKEKRTDSLISIGLCERFPCCLCKFNLFLLVKVPGTSQVRIYSRQNLWKHNPVATLCLCYKTIWWYLVTY